MASIRTIDFAIILVGHNHQQNGDFHEAPEAGFDIDTAAYEAAKRGRPEARTLVRVIGHAGDDIDSHKNQLMTFIRGKTNGNLNTIGSFCAIVTSNSCSTVLALAAELKGSGAPRLSYVGVIDVTFIPYGVGRQPPLPNGLGGLKPYNPPDKNAISNLELANPVNL